MQNEESNNSYFPSVTDRGEQEAYNWTEGDRFARCQVNNLDIKSVGYRAVDWMDSSGREPETVACSWPLLTPASCLAQRVIAPSLRVTVECNDLEL